MLMLKFYAGSSAFVVRGDDVQEVVPRVELIQLQGTPPAIIGVLNYGGTPVIIVDFCILIKKRPSKLALHSRIILLKGFHEGHSVIVGLLAENVTEVVNIEESAFKLIELEQPDKPFLGKVCSQSNVIIQEVLADKFIEWNRHSFALLEEPSIRDALE